MSSLNLGFYTPPPREGVKIFQLRSVSARISTVSQHSIVFPSFLTGMNTSPSLHSLACYSQTQSTMMMLIYMEYHTKIYIQ